MRKIIYLFLIIFLFLILSFTFIRFNNSQENNQSKVDENSDKLKKSYTEYLTGSEKVNTESMLEEKVSEVHKDASKRMEDFNSKENREKNGEKALFKDLTLGDNEENLSETFASLNDMALAVKTYKKEDGDVNFYNDKEMREKVIEGLDWVYNNFYEEQEDGYYGNWYDWEIGMPTDITKSLMLLEEDINQHKPELIESYVESMDQYLRKGKNGDIDLESRFHTGANLADITTNRIIQGALIDDEKRITKAINDQLTVFKTIDPNNIINGNTDGFYEDGSFIQHHTVAYTGAYGIELLDRIILTMEIVGDTKYDEKETFISTVNKWISKGFSPVIFEGYMMEPVKGRAISRPDTGYEDTNTVIEKLVQFSNHLSGKNKEELLSYIKYLVNSAKEDISAESFNSFDSILNFQKIMDNPAIKPEKFDKKNHHAFNLMDKNIHLRDSYSFALSRSSDRISKYEYMNGENLMPWFQGDGAYYLYMTGVNQTNTFGADYFATVDPFKLPGTTAPIEERKTVPQLNDGKEFYENTEDSLDFSSSSESQNKYVYFPVGTNDYSGSVKLKEYGVAGMQLGDTIGYKDKQEGLLPDDFTVYKNAKANKSYFMFDEEIVLLGSGISDDKDRTVKTTIDNRMYGEDQSSTIKGETIDNNKFKNPDNGDYDLKWINFQKEGDNKSQIGYYFPEETKVSVKQNKSTENLQRIRTSNPDTEVTKRFFTLDINHKKNPEDDKYAYVILPNFDQEKTDKYSKNPNINILSNSKHVHAVESRKEKVKGFNFFTNKKEKVSDITSFNEASIILKQDEDTFNLAISDPTFDLDEMKLEINIPDLEVEEASKAVDTSISKDKVTIYIDSKNSNGKSYNVKLNKK